MNINNINKFKECIYVLFSFFEKTNIPCQFGTFDKLKEIMETVYQSEIVSWECIPDYPSLSIDFKLSDTHESSEVYYFFFQDKKGQRQNSVLFDLSSYNESTSFIRFELYTSRYLPFVLGLNEVPGSIEVYKSKNRVEELDEINTRDVMSLTEFDSFLYQHPVPGKMTMVEFD